MKKASLIPTVAAAWLMATSAYAASVGFSKLSVPDPGNPPLEVGVWYPTDATPHAAGIGLFTQVVAPDAPVAGHGLKLVVMSHGHGGEFGGHSDTAYALAAAGFVAAALTHTGDNYRDESRDLDMANRVRDLHVLIDYMTARWRPGAIDPAQVGAFGFSAGGFTVLAAAGGNPDMSLFGPHCAAHPGVFDCVMTRSDARHGAAPPANPVYVHDGRIAAVVAAAPALGFTFAGAGLKNVTMPVQLWRAGDDAILPSPLYVEPVAAALPRAPDLHVVPGAGHFDFLAPCPPALAHIAASICTSAPGFDRVAFHRDFDRKVVAFFTRTLNGGEPVAGLGAYQRP
jgi:predicted dienelactone hydrolase